VKINDKYLLGVLLLRETSVIKMPAKKKATKKKTAKKKSKKKK
jgi:hypothetical protein